MPNNYTVKSSSEFINLLNSNEKSNIMASLDIESLFTNVPVIETTNIILNYVYRNETLTPPLIPEEYMKQLLLLCTTSTPFSSPDNTLYT